MDFSEDLALGYADPLRFVLWAFPWGQTPEFSLVKLSEPWASRYPGCKFGPDVWACELLDELGHEVKARHFDGQHAVKPLRYAISSGHGIGKSTLTAWLVCWILATRPGSKGVVTANTASQLETKTWAEITKWMKRSLVADLFDIKSTSITSKESPETWRIDALTCREENAESFAGLHAASATPFYIFDEASAIPEVIYDVAEGGLTDGEPMMFLFGNPTRNSGRFFECFHKRKRWWNTRKIDSRSVAITNKKQIGEWLDQYGEDSDFFRVRVRGEFPNASSNQFIPTSLAMEAAQRQPPTRRADAAILGVDIARFGDDDTVLATRIGRDATLPLERYHGLTTDQVIVKVKGAVARLRRLGFKRIYVNIDEGGLGVGTVDMLRADGFPVRGINFGSAADEPLVYNRKREEIWGRMKEWLKEGSIPDDQGLIDALTSPEFTYLVSGQVKLERKEDMKKRGLSSPDEADALALTFAVKVQEYESVGGRPEPENTRRDFNPFFSGEKYRSSNREKFNPY